MTTSTACSTVSTTAVCTPCSGSGRARRRPEHAALGVRTELDLEQVLGFLGLNRAFDPDAAEFDGLTDDRLFLHAAVQQGIIAVDSGIEAAVATKIRPARR